jgi:hypothetical protein
LSPGFKARANLNSLARAVKTATFSGIAFLILDDNSNAN